MNWLIKRCLIVGLSVWALTLATVSLLMTGQPLAPSAEGLDWLAFGVNALNYIGSLPTVGVSILALAIIIHTFMAAPPEH